MSKDGKMRNTIKIPVIALAAWVFASCAGEEPVPDTDGSALNVNGEEVFQYDEKTWQAVFFSPDNLFLMTDDGRNNWYRLSCDDFPSEVGQTVKADLSYKVAGSRNEVRTVSGLSLKVSEIDGDSGMVSLTDSDKKVTLSIICVR